MKRILSLAVVLCIPCMMFLQAAQSGRHYAAMLEIRRLETAQADWIEENRKLLSNIAVARSRERVGEAMDEAEGYRMVGPATTLRIRVSPGMERRDG